jgi:hypothetical protein
MSFGPVSSPQGFTMIDLVCFGVLESMLLEIFTKSIHALVIVELRSHISPTWKLLNQIYKAPLVSKRVTYSTETAMHEFFSNEGHRPHILIRKATHAARCFQNNAYRKNFCRIFCDVRIRDLSWVSSLRKYRACCYKNKTSIKQNYV